jgi:ribosome-associated translation inhibitor RaiA
MKASIDELTEKLLRQIKEEREKRRRRRGPDKRELTAAPLE